MNLLDNQEYSAFLHTIEENPDDDVARLVLADWLDEHDLSHNAEAIRRGIKTPKRFTFAEGESAIIAYRSERHDLPNVSVRLTRSYPGVRWTTYKGLVESAMMSWETWLEENDVLLEMEWLPEVVLTDRPDIVCNGRHTDQNGNYGWYAVPGRDWHHVAEGDDAAQIVLHSEWPEVARWTLPKVVRYIHQYSRGPHSPPGMQMMNERAQVGELVRLADGTEGILLAPMDADGYAPVRRK